MVEIKWEEPQDRRLGAGFDEIAEALRTRPGHWAVVAEDLNKNRTQASSLALGIRRGKYRAFQPQGQFIARSSGPVVWAAWIGEDGEFKADAEARAEGKEEISATAGPTAEGVQLQA